MSEDQYTGEFHVMLLIDSTARKVPIAKIDVDTAYLKGQVEAQCLPDPIYDLVIGNVHVPGARAAYDPDPSWEDHLQEANTVTARSQAKRAGESIPLKISSTDESSVVDREKPRQMQCGGESLLKYVEQSDKLSKPLKEAIDQIQKLSVALTQEQVRGVEREKAMRHLQDSLNNEQRRLSDMRDALNNEVQLTKQLEEKLSFEKLLKLEVERELAKSRANLAEVTRTKEALQQQLNKDRSLVCESANKLREGEDNAKQKDEVYDEVKSEVNTLRENCVKREGKQFMVSENLERSERANKEKDGEISSFIIEAPAEKIRVDEATTVGTEAVGVDANFRKEDNDEVEEVDFVDNVNFLETDDYVAKESVKDVAIGDNLSLM